MRGGLFDLCMKKVVATLTLAGIVLAGGTAAYRAYEVLAERKFGRLFIKALNQRSTDQLHALVIEKEDFVRSVWPKLPAADPAWNVSADDVWDLYAMKTIPGMQRMLADWGGKKLAFVAIRFGKTQWFGPIVVRRDPVIIARTPSDAEVAIHGAGPVVFLDGRYQLLTFQR